MQKEEDKTTFRSTGELKERHHKLSPSNVSNDQLLQSGLNVKQFTYLSAPNKQSFTFNRETAQSSLLSSLKDKYQLIIALPILEDTGSESSDCNQTIDSIIKGVDSLASINITTSSLLCILFVQKIRREEHYELFFNKKRTSPFQAANESAISPSKEFQASLMMYNNSSLSGVQVLVIHEPKTKEVESLECLYNVILPQLRSKQGLVYMVHIANGVLLSPESLHEMISLSDSQCPVVVPRIETIPIGLYAQIEHYANYQYNVFNINYYQMTKCLPISHSMALIRVDDTISNHIQDYFNTKINSNADINYHDTLFSLYLTEKNYSIIYLKNTICSIKRNHITFAQMMNYHTERSSGTFASVFNLLSFWLKKNMTSVSFGNKFALLFLFIGMFFDFTFPSMMSIVVYAIYNEAFQIKDPRVSIFLTGLYLLMIELTVCFSLMTRKNAEAISKIFLTFYIAFTVYYIFALVCAIPAIHFINTNPSLDLYKFDLAAFCSIIVINFVFGLLPLLFNIKMFFKNVVSALEYVALGVSGFTSVFLNHSIVNASDMIGAHKGFDGSDKGESEKILNYYKTLVIVLYGGTNAFFISILFFMTDRKMRVNAILALGIIYTIYNCIKVLLVVCGMFTGPKGKEENDDEENRSKKSTKQNEEGGPQSSKDEIEANNERKAIRSKLDVLKGTNAKEKDATAGEKDLFSIDQISNSDKSLEGIGRKRANEDDEIKEKSIEIDIVDKNDSEENERRHDNDYKEEKKVDVDDNEGNKKGNYEPEEEDIEDQKKEKEDKRIRKSEKEKEEDEDEVVNQGINNSKGKS